MGAWFWLVAVPCLVAIWLSGRGSSAKGLWSSGPMHKSNAVWAADASSLASLRLLDIPQEYASSARLASEAPQPPIRHRTCASDH